MFTDGNQLVDKVVDTLQGQLAEKDAQIQRLQTELSAMNESYRQLAESHVQIITQQQQLNAITMKQLPAPDTETDEIPTKPKRRWVFFWKK